MRMVSDKLVAAYYSADVEALKGEAKRALVRAGVLGVGAVAAFGLLGLLLLVGVHGGIGLIFLLLLSLLGLLTVACVISSWLFSFRWIYLVWQIKKHVDTKLRESVNAAISVPPSSVHADARTETLSSGQRP